MMRLGRLPMLLPASARYSESALRGDTRVKDVDMALTLEALLSRLRADHDLDLAAVVSDGATVAADAISGIDVDTVCNTVGDLVLLNATLGAEMDSGLVRASLIEYERGAVVITPLRTGEDLVLLSSDTTNLGRIRLAALRFYDAYSGHAVRS